jgi:hypothetical protein
MDCLAVIRHTTYHIVMLLTAVRRVNTLHVEAGQLKERSGAQRPACFNFARMCALMCRIASRDSEVACQSQNARNGPANRSARELVSCSRPANDVKLPRLRSPADSPSADRRRRVGRGSRIWTRDWSTISSSFPARQALRRQPTAI